MAIVYRHKNKVTQEVFYIGIGKTEKRAYSKHSRGKFWKDYTSKYDYEVEITHKDIIWEEACSIEKYLISFYGRRDLGLGNLVNQTDGGDGNNGIIQTQEANNKRSFALKGKKKPKGFNIGRKHSKETIEKLKHPKNVKKLEENIQQQIINLYKINSIEEISKLLNLSFYKIIKFLRDNNLYLAKRKSKIKNKICPYCNLEGRSANMTRYHFENCKLKSN
jgi:hypothetical protein